LIERSKRAVGEFLRMRSEDFALVCNATEGVASVLASMRLEAGDEIVTTNHVYNAVRQAMRRAARESGVEYREIEVTTSVASADEIVERVVDGLSARTRLLVIDHVTSPTGLIFPVGRVASECARRGVEVLVDGAHGPGMFELDVPAVGATWYTGNLHKWACCPRAVGFLWTRADWQGRTHPAVMSHHYEKPFAAEFEWVGTRDPSAAFSVPGALRFMRAMGWERVYAHNRALNVWAGKLLRERWGVEALARDESLVGSMTTVCLPGALAAMGEEQAGEFQKRLYHRQGIEIPVVWWQGKWHVRISCQVYNSAEEYERFATIIASIANESN
jgi:isopenicillin-N epimerase